MTAKTRYDVLSSDRSQYLKIAEDAAKLTIPYLIHQDDAAKGARSLTTPWQGVGAKGVVTLAAKLMLSLLPPQTSFFKLQIADKKLADEAPPEVVSDLDLAFAKIERIILDQIAASDDRVQVHQAMKHLVVTGNALLFMGKDGMKLFPLNRYVIDRDGNGNVLEIVTKEKISKKIIEKLVPNLNKMDTNADQDELNNDCDVYTHVKVDGTKVNWHQEVYDKIIPKSQGKSPLDATPWIPLRFNAVDGEDYGRGRVEEFIGDLKSLEALSQALVEGSAAASKVVFTVSPSSSTKPQTLAQAGNGAIIQGRPDDIGVVQVGKTADFSTAYQVMQQLEKRLSEAFLILSVRQSERTTAEEVRMTQLELEQQLGGLFSLLTVEFLVPYLDRKLNVMQKSGDIPRIPKEYVHPTIVAGINALGRGQDRESLTMFMQTIAQTIGPEAMMQYINPDEVIKRLAASSGIDVLNLVKSMEERQGEQQQQMQQQMAMQEQQNAPATAAVDQKQMQAEMQMAMQAQQPPPQ